jgi:hypothetical protein
VSQFCLPLVRRRANTGLYKATPARFLDSKQSYQVSRFCLPLVRRRVSTGLYKATPVRLLDKAGLSGESVSSATTEGGKNRSVQGNPGRAPKSKAKLQVERNKKR